MTQDTPNTQAPPKEAIAIVIDENELYAPTTGPQSGTWLFAMHVEVIDFYAEPVTAH